MSVRTPHAPVKQNDRHTACGSMLPSFAFLSVEARSSVVLADSRGECLEPSSFGRVSIAYSGSTTNTSFHFWNAKPNDALSLSIGMDPEEAPAQEEEEDDAAPRRGGRQKLTVRTPPSLIEPGDFDPEDEDKFSYDVLRKELREQYTVLRAIARRWDGEDMSADENAPLPDGEVIDEALGDVAEFISGVGETMDNLLLLCAYQIYAFNPGSRDDVKSADGSLDVDDELLARWRLGKEGRGKERVRLHPKSHTIDRVNYGRSMGTMSDSMKEEVTSRVVEIFDLFNTMEGMQESDEELGEVAQELADELVLFEGDTFDLNFWSTHQNDPVPLLTEKERSEYDVLDSMCSELEALGVRQKAGSGTTEEASRMTQLTTLISNQKEQLEAMRLESILTLISQNENLQNRAAYRIDRAKHAKHANSSQKRGMDSESAGMHELQKIMNADRKKAAYRAKKYVAYRVILARRKQLAIELTGVNAEIARAQADKAVEAESKWRALKLELEARIKEMVVPQRNARVASSAPRYRMEGRTKGGWLGKRVSQKRTKLLGNSSTSDRTLGLSTADVNQIALVEGKLTQLLSHRAEEGARSVLVDIVQVLTSLTGLPNGAVSRTDLPPESRMEKNSVAIISADWGGRQDVDLVAMYKYHRPQFEQMLKMLIGWQRVRIDRAKAANQEELDRIDEAQKQLALRVADRTARDQRAGTSDESDGDSVDSEQSETPGDKLFQDTLLRPLAVFNASRQELGDFQTVIRELEETLLRYGPRIPRSKAFEVRRIIERLRVEMYRKHRA